MRSTLLVLALSACYSPGYRDCEITCASQSCPSGYSCNAGGFCVSDPQLTCNGVGSDGGMDVMVDMGMQGMGPWNPATPAPFLMGTPVGADDQPSLTDDMLNLYVRRVTGGQHDIFGATRSSVTVAFASPVNVSSLSTGAFNEWTPELGGNGLTIHFSSDRNGTAVGFEIYSATRTALGGNWNNQQPISTLNGPASDESPTVSRDGLTMVFTSTRNDAGDIFISERPLQSDPWPMPVNAGQVNNMGRRDEGPFLSTDKLTIYFSSDRPGGAGGFDLWQATRPNLSMPFGPAMPIMELNTSGNERDPWVSPDGKHIFFSGTPMNVLTIMEATR